MYISIRNVLCPSIVVAFSYPTLSPPIPNPLTGKAKAMAPATRQPVLFQIFSKQLFESRYNHTFIFINLFFRPANPVLFQVFSKQLFESRYNHTFILINLFFRLIMTCL
uniref:Uncharacterized protein n=1 Tax=Anguilla anguilla TaxID=7936 RepID=A0A0E9X3M0_ANGAN